MDLKNPRWMYLKAGLFVGIGVCCFALVLLEHPTLLRAAFLAVMVWAFCRAYYFAFYVMEKYIDPQYRFSGLTSFVAYLVRQRRTSHAERPNHTAAVTRRTPGEPHP